MIDEKPSLQDHIELVANFIGDNFLQLARQLRDLQDFDTDKPTEQKRFIKVVDHLRIGRRKAYQLARVSRIFQDRGIPEGRLCKIGWSKLAIIGRYLTEKNVDTLLKMAEQNIGHDLSVLLRGDQPIDKARVLVLYVDQIDYIRLRKAMLKNGASPSGKGMTNVEPALMQLINAAGY